MLPIRLVLCAVTCVAAAAAAAAAAATASAAASVAAADTATASAARHVHTVLPERGHDAGPYDADEYGVRNYVSEHELPRDVPTRVRVLGDLGTPPPGLQVDFVPTQTYVQVRRYDAVRRLPQEAAMQEAATSEEAANAPRLREVVTHKKTQEVYEEQGYEDAGYDHGGSKKLKVEEEVKDNQSVELFRPNNTFSYDTEETKNHGASVSPSGRGTWSRQKTVMGKKTKYEEDGDKRKVTIDDSSPVSEKSSGNYTKFDGGKTIVVQNLTQTEKKDYKKDGAESRRVASFSKTKDDVEATTYRPVMRHDNDKQYRHTVKQNRSEQKTNRTRSRPRKRPEANVQKPQADVKGSYDNSPWIPISPPTDYNGRPQSEDKKPVKSTVNSELYEINGHDSKYGYTINHDTPYQYVFPTDLLAPESSIKPIRKLKQKSESSDVINGKRKETSYGSHEFIPQTNYDGSAINPKQKKVTKSSVEDFSFDNLHLPSTKRYKDGPSVQFKTVSTHTKPGGSATTQRQKNKPVQVGSSENFNSNLKLVPYWEQQKKITKHIEEELANYGNSGTLYKSIINQDINPPKTYDAPFITRLKKNNFNGDSSGDPTLRIYPKYEIHPNYQTIKHTIKDEPHHGQRPISNYNKGYATIEQIENPPPRNTKHENNRLSEYPKFNNRPKNVYKPSLETAERWENYPKIRDQTPQLSEQKYNTFNKGESYPKFEQNKRYEITSTKSSPIYRLVPYEKSVKMNNPYSYVYHDDHYPSGSRQSSVKVEGTTQSPKLNNRGTIGIHWNNWNNWNNRHPHLPKDSIRSNTGDYKGRSDDENARHVENLTLAHFSGLHKSDSYRPLPLEYNERVNNLAKLLNDNYPKRTRRDLEVINIASSGTTTEIPVDTVVYSHYKKAPKESALRYATNPNLTPRKTAGGMEFYESTDSVKCTDISAPEKIVPERGNDGEWLGEPSINSPRVDAVGDTIGCFKTKYFGSDPLDNPIFKEKDVGFPDVLFSMKKPPEKVEEIEPGKPHVDWNFADELIPGQWFPTKDNKDKRMRRSDNKSLPVNHKVEGMESIMPEPIILNFPTKPTAVVYTNVSKTNTAVKDSQVSSNDEHVFKYTVQHPKPKPDLNNENNHFKDHKIIGLIPPPQMNIKMKKQQNSKKHKEKKILKKIKVDGESDEPDLLDVLSPITSIFTDEDDVATPIVHNFFNIKLAPSAKLSTTTTVDKNSGEALSQFQMQSYSRTKRNMKGVDLQKPKQRKLNFNTNANVSLSSPTARVRVYSPKNGPWFREKRDRVPVNVDVRRKEPRYYYYTERPRVRVKRVVHSPPSYSRSGHVFSSKYLVSDQEKSESLPEEINVAFSTTPKYDTTPKFIPAIAFGDSKTKMIKYNDSIANSTNDIERAQFDKKGSLIYVISPDTGVGKWMQVIKVKNEEGSKSALTSAPVYLEKKVKDVPSLADDTIGKFGFSSMNKNLFKKALGPTIDHRFKFKFPTKELSKGESKEQPKKAICPKITRPKKKEVRRRPTTTTTTTEIPVEEEVDERPEEQSGEDENAGPQEDGDGGENEDDLPHIEVIERPQYHQESEENSENPENSENSENSENPENAEYEDQDQDVYESKRKKPHSFVKIPKFKGYYLGSRNKNKNIK